MNSLVRELSYFFFPATCISCKEDLIKCHDQPFSLCVSCRIKINWNSHMEYLVDSPLDCFIALAEFKGPLRELIHAFKYRGKGYLARELSQRLVSTLQDSGVSWDCLVPVPMSSWKELKRGYNPPFLVAREMASQLKSAFYPNFLVRNFFSRSQTKMGRKERFHNAVKGFKLKRRDKVLSGQSVLLVDDVSTTGATLVVCARLLKSLGAIRVGGIVIAKDVLDI